MNVDKPHLLGRRCVCCGVYVFPGLGVQSCPSPACASTDFEQVELSRVGKVWSYTSASYAPPAPYVAADPFEPFAIAAVELEKEQIVILGQVSSGVSIAELEVGSEVELVLEVLFEDEEQQQMMWKWKPTGEATKEGSDER